MLPSFSLFSQNYTPFFLDSVAWIESTTIPAIGPGDGGKVWAYRTKRDTLVQGKTYRNLTRQDLCEYRPDPQGNRQYLDIDHTERLIGGLREEAKRVYFLSYDSMQETLLYDFSFSIPDTIHYAPGTYTIITRQKASRQGLNVYEALNSKAWAFPNQTSEIIEGIGGTYGLFGSYVGLFDRLSCFQKAGDTLIFENCDLCEGYVTGREPTEAQDDIRVFPNPFQDVIRISGNLNRVRVLEVYDSKGRIIQRQFHPVGLQKLDLSQVSRGGYLLNIWYDNGRRVNHWIMKI